jgi:hypothetical protein
VFKEMLRQRFYEKPSASSQGRKPKHPPDPQAGGYRWPHCRRDQRSGDKQTKKRGVTFKRYGKASRPVRDDVRERQSDLVLATNALERRDKVQAARLLRTIRNVLARLRSEVKTKGPSGAAVLAFNETIGGKNGPE